MRKGKFVCSECLGDKHLKEFVTDRAEEIRCSYCQLVSKDEDMPIAAPIDDFFEYIEECIKQEYGNCWEHGASWDEEEQEYGGVENMDSRTILNEVYSDSFNNDDLVDDLIDYLRDNEPWCEVELIGPEHELWIEDWSKFSNHVKHHTRFVFLRTQESDKYSDPRTIPIADMLDSLGGILTHIGAIKSIPPQTPIYRARLDEGKFFSTVAELGTPPPDSSKAHNRMNPQGIPILYGALDRETSMKEVSKERGTYKVSLADFRLLKPIKVLDLTKLAEEPSVFDAAKRKNISAFRFLHHFVQNISSPITSSGREHIEYVPSQIVTEYFRRIYRTKTGEPIMGILYPSSLFAGEERAKHICCALFVENGDCCEGNSCSEDHILRLESIEHIAMEKSE